MDLTEFDELLERGRGNGGDSGQDDGVPVEIDTTVEELDEIPAVEEVPEESPPEVVVGEVVEEFPIGTPENPLPYIKPNKSRYVSTVKKETVPHPTREGCTCWYYPDTEYYRSDGSDGRQPGQFIKSPMHPKFEAQMFKTSEDGQRALQQNRDKKRAAMERGVKAAVAEKKGKALDDVSDEDAIEYTAKVLTEEIVLNEKAPARERWQFWVKMLEVNGIIENTDVKGNTLAIQVNVDPTIGRTFK